MITLLLFGVLYVFMSGWPSDLRCLVSVAIGKVDINIALQTDYVNTGPPADYVYGYIPVLFVQQVYV